MAAILNHVHTCLSLQVLARGAAAGLLPRGFVEMQFEKFEQRLGTNEGRGLQDVIRAAALLFGRKEVPTEHDDEMDLYDDEMDLEPENM